MIEPEKKQAQNEPCTSASQVNTSGGAYVGDDVSITNGDFVGRDKITIGKLIANIFSSDSPQTLTQTVVDKPLDTRIARRRREMLALVEDTWIKGLLRPSLQNEGQLQVQLATVPELVDNRPFAELVQMPDAPQVKIIPQQDIVALFRQSQQRLLLLGEPGSGKTTLLLLMAQAMIESARQDDTQPIPIVFNLASWSPSHSTLDSWILSELKEKYLIPNKLAAPWLANDDLIFLLDGLDEVAEIDRGACLAVINQFLGEHRAPMVVCCRKTEYMALSEQLRLPLAVQIVPLTQQQIADYLQGTGGDASTLLDILQSDTNVNDLVSTPLGLHIVRVAAGNIPAETWVQDSTTDEWQTQLFATYIFTMFHRRSGRHPYSPQQTVKWLGWLAGQMMVHGQSIFLIEQMQPTFLANRRQQWLYQIGTRFAGALCFLISCPLVVFGLVVIYNRDLENGFIALGLGFLLGGVISIALLVTSILARWVHDVVAVVLAGGLLAALLVIGFLSILSELASGSPLTDAILVTIVFGPLGSLPGLFLSGKRPIRPVRDISWSWKDLQFAVLIGLIGSGGLGLLIGLLIGTANGLGIGFMVGLCCVLPASLFGISRREKISPAVYPNQGIRNSVHTALLVFVVITFIAGSIGVLWHLFGDGNSSNPLIEALAVGAIMGVLIGISAALVAGGATSLQHYLLRCLLARSGALPWRVQHFLDYATERAFLSRIGGGYMFYHRLLMEHLANTKETSHDTER